MNPALPSLFMSANYDNLLEALDLFLVLSQGQKNTLCTETRGRVLRRSTQALEHRPTLSNWEIFLESSMKQACFQLGTFSNIPLTINRF